jgi:uncharacterized protein (TIGR02391 family)
MVRKSSPTISEQHTNFQEIDIAKAIRKLTKRLEEARSMPAPTTTNEISTLASSIVTKVNATYDEVFGAGTVEAKRNRILASRFHNYSAYDGWVTSLKIFEGARQETIAQLQTNIELFSERLDDGIEDVDERVLRAYENLELHREIANAASDLYKNGHYANAIEDAVKALNNLVRLRSGIDADGSKLMTSVFSPENPILKFNDLADLSDKDEQRGFMMMFAGAVAGLRNPRAHKFIKDDPERALEFIAFVSLLAKLLDGAKK